MTEKLKPCFKCGGTARFGWCEKDGWFAECTSCDLCFMGFDNCMQAVGLWNLQGAGAWGKHVDKTECGDK